MHHPNRPFLVLALLAAIAACSDPGPTSVNTPVAGTEPAATPATEEPLPAAGTTPAASEPATPAQTTDAVPTRFQGRYATDATACNAAGHESRLQIDAERIAFHESSGAVTAVSGNADEITIEARVTGEGETRQASWTFRLGADGNTLTDVAAGMIRVRCG